MPLKKRMFRWNMMILFTALFSLMVIILAVLVLFEDSLEEQVKDISQARLESHVGEVAQVMAAEEMRSPEELLGQVGQWGYETAVIVGGERISGVNEGSGKGRIDGSAGAEGGGEKSVSGSKECISGGEDPISGGKSDSVSAQMREAAGFLQDEQLESGKPEIFSFQKATIVAKSLPDEGAVLVAAHIPPGNWLVSSLNDSFFSFIAAVIAAGTGGILVLLVLASFFTRRMNRMVMEPVELLTAGAKRVSEGRLDEAIAYQGEAEFEHVCQTFNDMQRIILEDKQQRARTEQARIDMVTGISHDLRTPLTSIQGYIKGVLDGVAGTEEKKRIYLQTAYEATEEMNVLLQKLFDFSRMESGQMPFHMVKADLAEFAAAYAAQKAAAYGAQKATDFAAQKAEAYGPQKAAAYGVQKAADFAAWKAADNGGQKAAVTDPDRLQISFRGEFSLPEISMDVEQVRRILDNLLENSLKYAGRLPVQVELSAEELTDSIRLVWKDNGRGVPEEKLGRIFERFYRCDEARKEKGSGVGLYVVQYIMERHGGRVEAENDGGLKLSLYFPKEA